LQISFSSSVYRIDTYKLTHSVKMGCTFVRDNRNQDLITVTNTKFRTTRAGIKKNTVVVVENEDNLISSRAQPLRRKFSRAKSQSIDTKPSTSFLTYSRSPSFVRGPRSLVEKVPSFLGLRPSWTSDKGGSEYRGHASLNSTLCQQLVRLRHLLCSG
jgi:hypothetical protein